MKNITAIEAVPEIPKCLEVSRRRLIALKRLSMSTFPKYFFFTNKILSCTEQQIDDDIRLFYCRKLLGTSLHLILTPSIISPLEDLSRAASDMFRLLFSNPV